MPFTISHPAFALPVKYISPRYVCTTGLILGSMSPDFEYFLRLEPYQTIGHTLAGLFIYAIPLCILLAFLYHRVLKWAVAIHLPSVYQIDQRVYHQLSHWNLRTFRDWLVFIYSVIAGFVSHVLIDAFTHRSGFFVMKWPFLRLELQGLPLYKILQYGLSVTGLVVIWMLLWSRWRQTNIPSAVNLRVPAIDAKRKWAFWLLAEIITLLTILIKFAFTTSSNLLGMMIVAPISGLFLGLCISSVIFGKVKGK